MARLMSSTVELLMLQYGLLKYRFEKYTEFIYNCGCKGILISIPS